MECYPLSFTSEKTQGSEKANPFPWVLRVGTPVACGRLVGVPLPPLALASTPSLCPSLHLDVSTVGQMLTE